MDGFGITYPKQQLHENDIAQSSGNVERGSCVVGTVRSVDVFEAGVGEHEHRTAHVLSCNGVDQLLRDGNICVG